MGRHYNPILHFNTKEQKLIDVAKVSGGSHYIANFHGGCNGGGNWNDYLDEIKKAFKSLHWWMIKLENDCIDDIFYLTIGFTKE